MNGYLFFSALFIYILSVAFCAEDLVISGIVCGQVIEKADQLTFTFSDKDVQNLASLSAQNVEGFAELDASFAAFGYGSLSALHAGELTVNILATDDRIKWETFRGRMAPWYANWSTLSFRVMRVSFVTFIVSFFTSHCIAFIWWKLAPKVIYSHLRYHPFLLKHVYFYVIPKEDRYMFQDDFEDDDDFALTMKVNEILYKVSPSAVPEIKERAAQLARLERLRKLKILKAKRQVQEGKVNSSAMAVAENPSDNQVENSVSDTKEPTIDKKDTENTKDPSVDKISSEENKISGKEFNSSPSSSSKEGNSKEESKGVTLFSVSLTIGIMTAAIFA